MFMLNWAGWWIESEYTKTTETETDDQELEDIINDKYVDDNGEAVNDLEEIDKMMGVSDKP